MTQLRIDRIRKTIELELELNGETEPIKVRVGGYDLKTDDDGTTLSAAEVVVSREWMNSLAAELLQNKPLRIPPDVAKWLRLAL